MPTSTEVGFLFPTELADHERPPPDTPSALWAKPAKCAAVNCNSGPAARQAIPPVEQVAAIERTGEMQKLRRFVPL